MVPLHHLFTPNSLPSLSSQSAFTQTFNMPAGSGPGFRNKDAQNAWIEGHMSAYIKKLAHNKPFVPGQPLPADDADLHSWVVQRGKEFEAHFKSELEDELSMLPEDQRPGKIKQIRDVSVLMRCIIYLALTFMGFTAIQSSISQQKTHRQDRLGETRTQTALHLNRQLDLYNNSSIGYSPHHPLHSP